MFLRIHLELVEGASMPYLPSKPYEGAEDPEPEKLPWFGGYDASIGEIGLPYGTL